MLSATTITALLEILDGATFDPVFTDGFRAELLQEHNERLERDDHDRDGARAALKLRALAALAGGHSPDELRDAIETAIACAAQRLRDDPDTRYAWVAPDGTPVTPPRTTIDSAMDDGRPDATVARLAAMDGAARQHDAGQFGLGRTTTVRLRVERPNLEALRRSVDDLTRTAPPVSLVEIADGVFRLSAPVLADAPAKLDAFDALVEAGRADDVDALFLGGRPANAPHEVTS